MRVETFGDLYMFFKAPSCRIVSRVGRRPRAPVFVELGMRLNDQLSSKQELLMGPFLFAKLKKRNTCKSKIIIVRVNS